MTVALSHNLREFAGQKWPTMNHKWRKAKLASMLRMSERRVRSIYEADPAARIRADEAERIAALVQQGEAEDAALSTRIAELEAQVTRLVEALASDEMAGSGLAPRLPGRTAFDRRGPSPGRRSTD